MKFLNRCAAFGLAMSLLTSCSQEAPWGVSGDEGKINLKLSTDASVYTSTRAKDNESPVRPSGDMFKIRLESTDQSYSKEWESTTAFNKEEGFPRGTYTLHATYGDLEQEGFQNPYYVGSESVEVTPGGESSVLVEAALANSMVSIRYGENFSGSFSQYAAALVSETGTPVVFVQDEVRPAYVKPGQIKVEFSLTNHAGQSVTVSPATFTAVPRRHYIVTVNVENSAVTGEEVLNVIFEEDVVADRFEIVLTDELYNAPEPEIILTGVDGTEVDTFEKMSLKDINPEFHVKAYGGIKSAVFSVAASNGQLPPFGANVELVGADEITQANIASSYLDCYGFFQNTGQMAVVNMKRFIENLEPGDYLMSLEMTDGLGRVISADHAVTLSAKVKTLDFDLACNEKPKYMGKEISVDFTTNYDGAKDMVSFRIADLDANLQDAKVLSVTPISGEDNVGADGRYAYRYVLEVPEIDDSELLVEATCGGKVKQVSGILVDLPEYEVEVDPFARKVMLKIVPEDPSQLANIMSHMKVYMDNGATHIPSTAYPMTRDEENGIFVLSGLTSETRYEAIGVSIGSKYENNHKLVGFTTDREGDVPNGGFQESTQTINITGVQVGGQYRVSPVDYTLKSSIVRNTPNSWANLNQLTCYEGSTNKNTWFLVPSTFVDNNYVIVRTVGYNHNGTTPGTSGGAFNTTYYCTNAPSDSQLEKAAGELFLGSYSYSGTESRHDGMAFSCRPDYITFTYQYIPYGNEEGEMYVRILDASGNVLTSNSVRLTAVNNIDRTVTLPLEGYKFGEKAASIQLCFRSTASDLTPGINIPSGSDLDEYQRLGNHTLDANSYHAFAMGSELKIKSVRLGYGDTSASQTESEPSRVAKRRK